MDRINRYKAIVKEITLATGKLGERPEDPVKTQMILDEERGHYLLYFNGWRGEKRTYGSYLHIEVTDKCKIYLHHDGTNLLIAQQLVDQGIPKEDIVLAWNAPIRRPDTGFAVA